MHYVNNKQLYSVLIDYRHDIEENEDARVPSYVGEAVMLICERLSRRPNFVRFTYRDEMVGDAIENCMAAVRNFDPQKTSNPFGYFTQIAWNAFLRRIQKERKQSYIRAKSYEHFATDAEMRVDESDRVVIERSHHDGANRLISSFEKKIPRKRGSKRTSVARQIG